MIADNEQKIHDLSKQLKDAYEKMEVLAIQKDQDEAKRVELQGKLEINSSMMVDIKEWMGGMRD